MRQDLNASDNAIVPPPISVVAKNVETDVVVAFMPCVGVKTPPIQTRCIACVQLASRHLELAVPPVVVPRMTTRVRKRRLKHSVVLAVLF